MNEIYSVTDTSKYKRDGYSDMGSSANGSSRYDHGDAHEEAVERCAP